MLSLCTFEPLYIVSTIGVATLPIVATQVYAIFSLKSYIKTMNTELKINF